ncbi:MAG TPA: hypothetical protein VFU65_15050 [Actinocrinis sp.]|nr:hypothetical protein [Actinocrinis sp.]
MDGRRLSVREQRILAEIETVLRRDRRLDERLRDLRLPLRLRLLSVQRRLRGAELSLLIPTTLLLALAAGRTGTLAVVIAACGVGALTVLLLYGVVRSRIERRRRERWGVTMSRMTFPEP